MTITQTVEIPANRRQMTIDVPREIPAGRTILTFTPAPESSLHDCPICAQNKRKYDPETGNPLYNAETIAAIEEGIAISRGEIPAKRFSSLKEMLEDIERDDSDVSSSDVSSSDVSSSDVSSSDVSSVDD